ncbi:hypothetical protein ACFL6K_01000, partial [Candidatus Latescibacterota bacterium]
WINGNFYYSFDMDGVMRAIKIDSDPVFYQSYKYELISMGGLELIRYGKDLSDSASVSFLFAESENDSVSTFAYCTSFVRTDSTSGITGAWRYVDGDMVIDWNIGKNTIDYSQSFLDFDTGEMVAVEELHGTYTIGKSMVDTGWYYIDFQDDKRAVVLPIQFKDILYMFDLNMSRSRFMLTDNAPTYNDYKAAQKSIMPPI